MFKKLLMIIGVITLCAAFVAAMLYVVGWYLMHNTPFGA